MIIMTIIILKIFNNQTIKIVDRQKAHCNKKINWLYKILMIKLKINKLKT
jgi:hypothetical protein